MTFGECDKCGMVFPNEHEAKYHGLDQLHWCPAKFSTENRKITLKCPKCGHEWALIDLRES